MLDSLNTKNWIYLSVSQKGIFVIADDKSLWYIGKDNIYPNFISKNIFTKVGDKQWKVIKANSYFVYDIDINNQLYGWGCNFYATSCNPLIIYINKFLFIPIKYKNIKTPSIRYNFSTIRCKCAVIF
jgi:hypothetical protein